MKRSLSKSRKLLQRKFHTSSVQKGGRDAFKALIGKNPYVHKHQRPIDRVHGVTIGGVADGTDVAARLAKLYGAIGILFMFVMYRYKWRAQFMLDHGDHTVPFYDTESDEQDIDYMRDDKEDEEIQVALELFRAKQIKTARNPHRKGENYGVVIDSYNVNNPKIPVDRVNEILVDNRGNLSMRK